MSLFARLSTALTTKGARLDFELVSLGEGQLRVRVAPNLGPCPVNASAEEQQLRALLGEPLTISGTPTEIDDLLDKRLQQRMEIQEEGLRSLASLQEKMSAATAAASKAKPASNAKKPETTSDQSEEAEDSAAQEKVQRVPDAPSIDDL